MSNKPIASLRRYLVVSGFIMTLAATIGVVGVLAQSQTFLPAFERYLWKAIGDWGTINNPAVTGTDGGPYNNQGPNEFNEDVLVSSVGGFATLEEQFGFASSWLHTGECTFSLNGDRDEIFFPRKRQCKDSTGLVATPPPLGHLLNPVGLAVDGTKVYVSDEYNHRIQVFDFMGNLNPPAGLAFPIGNGVPGPDGLSAPYGIAVDASADAFGKRLLVADGGNGRVAIFKSDGSPAFNDTNAAPIHFTVPDGPSATDTDARTWPNLLALTPGAIVREPGTGVASPDPANHRIVVTDWVHCSVFVFDTAFNLIKSLPTAADYDDRPPFQEGVNDQYQHDACVNPENLLSPPRPGEFSTVTGAAVDAWGRIYIADHAQNVVQVFDSNGVFLFRIGKPGEAQGDAVLSGPVGVTVDHLGRVAVTDAGNARVVFYSVSSPGDPLSVSVQFQLDTTVAFDDFPIGFAEQIGPIAEGLDPKGRFVATNPLRRSVLRFELPDLVVANASADNGTGLGTFDVAVPSQKVGVVNTVAVTVTPVDEAGNTLSSPLPTSISVLISGAPVLVANAVVDLAPGSFASYQFEFPPVIGGSVRFRITAVGSAGESDESNAVARASCGTTCGAGHAVFFENESPATTTNGWYGDPVFVRITPTSTDLTDPVVTISWSYGGVAGLYYNASVRETTVPLGLGYIDVPVRVSGQSTITYRAITESGTISPPSAAVVLPVDLEPPFVQFEWKDASGAPLSGSNWYKQPVYGHYTVSDDHSGPSPTNPAGPFEFLNEGRAQAQSAVVSDKVGHVADADSANSTGGRLINIDLTAPYFCVATVDTPCADETDESGLPASLTFVATTQDVNGGYADVSGIHGAQASDPKLQDGSDGSGVALIVASPSRFYVAGNGTAANLMTFSVTDAAGNVRTATRPVIVNKKSQTITFAPLVNKTYGDADFTVSATADSGLPVSFTATGSCTVTASGTVHLTGAGSCTITASQAGDAAYYEAADDVVRSFTVDKALATWTTAPNSKAYGTADPAPLTTGSGSGFIDTVTATYSRTAGETVAGGPYPITATLSAALGVLDNYTITNAGAAFTITKAAATVTVSNLTPTYDGSPKAVTVVTVPAGLTVTVTYDGSTTAPTAAGSYAVVATIDDANYSGTATETLVIGKASAMWTTTPNSKTYGTADPAPLTTGSGSGFIDTVTAAYSRTAGETVAGSPYSITATLSAAPGVLDNYTITNAGAAFTITKAAATVTVPNAMFTYDGTAKTASASTSPSGLAVTFTYDGSTTAPTAAGSYAVVATIADANHSGTGTGTLVINQASQTITFGPLSGKTFGNPDFTVSATATSGLAVSFVASGNCTMAGPATVHLTAPGSCTITASQGGNMNFSAADPVARLFVIAEAPANSLPDAVDDSVAVNGTGPVTIAVLGNDTDPDGNALTIASVSAVTPAGAGSVTIVGNPGTTVVFQPSETFAGTAMFSYTVSDNQGGFDTATVTLLSCNLTGFRTQSQGGWGAKPSGNNAGKFLRTNFAAVYSAGSVTIGGTQTLTFTSSAAIEKYLPRGGSPSVLTANDTNPTSGSAGGGVFAGQVLALQLSVDFSVAGVTRPGLGGLVLVSGPLVGRTVSQVLVMANAVLGGNVGALPPGLSISGLNAIVDAINNNFVGGTANQGYLIGPGCTPNQPPVFTADDQQNAEGDTVSLQLVATDPNDEDLSYSAIGLPPGLTIDDESGLVSGTLTGSSAGTYNVTVTVTDPAGACVADTFVWTVDSSNRPPSAADDLLSTTKNAAKTLSVLLNDSDPDGDTLKITSVTQPSAGTGTAVKYNDSTVKYTPPSNWTGTTSFTYTIDDGKGGSDTATVSVSVTRSRDDDCDHDHDGDHDGDHDSDDDHDGDDDRDWYRSNHRDDDDRGVGGHSSSYGGNSWSSSYDGHQWCYHPKW